jgi:hypothetical protein
MEGYVKPIILSNEEVAEGIFAASGGLEVVEGGGEGDYGTKPSCDSIYMNGEFRPQSSAPGSLPNIERYGCNGCRAYRGDHCVLSEPGLEQPETWASYRGDDGYRLPQWESLGYLPDGENYF